MKDIKGFESLYQITDEGQVFSLITKKYLKPTPDKDGYLQVKLYINGKQFTRKIHRLVAEAFLDNPENKKEVNHIDCHRDNNNASNLEWVSHRENTFWQAQNGNLFPNRKLTYHF